MSRSRTRASARALAAALVLGVGMTGCSDIYYDRRDTVSLGADDAIASNRVTHMVDPWPRESSNRNIAFNGQRMQAAVERYRHHDVILPRPYTTTNMTQQQMTTITESVPIAPPSATGAPAALVK